MSTSEQMKENSQNLVLAAKSAAISLYVPFLINFLSSRKLARSDLITILLSLMSGSRIRC